MSCTATAHRSRLYRVLIVDDDEIDRRHYAKLLVRSGSDSCDIHEAADGATGLAALRSEPFDCVLLDFSLPDMTGIEFLGAAATDAALPCAVVVITGRGDEAIAVEAMKRGAQDYLVKERVTNAGLWRALTAAVTQNELRLRLDRSLRELTAANAALEHEALIRRAAEAELRVAKEAAEQASRAKTRFVAMVSHELRTPLNGILGYAQLLRLEGGLTAAQDGRVRAMIQAGHHLLEMIQCVLDFASIENGRMQIQAVPLAVCELCERCLALMEPIAAEHRLGLRMVVASSAPRQVITDPARLRQVVLNLLGNAVKYTVAGSVELRVLPGPVAGALRIEVADTGPGIDEAGRSHLFQDFERLINATAVEGAGLGLAIAARIVGLMNGSIGYMDNPGGGSVFWLELPPSAAEPVPALQSAPALPATSSQHVLLVDDLAMNLDVIGAFLRSAGHQVVPATSGQEAIRLAQDQLFDLILMDVRMPDMDGLEATRRIRALPAPFGTVPVLALTAYTFPEQVAQCLDAGMNGHIGKPVDHETLNRAIGDIASNAAPEACDPADAITANGADADQPATFDRAAFDATIGFLPPGGITASLASMRDLYESTLRLLDEPEAGTKLNEAAHGIASIGGTFGFEALSVAARLFEATRIDDMAARTRTAQTLRSETAAAMAILNDLILERGGQPP